MGVNIDLGTYSFDTAAVQKNLEDTTKKMFDLKQVGASYREENKSIEKSLSELDAVQKLLIKTGASQSKSYAENEARIKTLNKQKEQLFEKELKNKDALKEVSKEYRETNKVLSAFKDTEGELVDSTEAVNNALDREVKSISQARKSNKELLAIRNEIDLSTEEGVIAMERLNDKLNENNQFVKENVSGYEQQKINIGDYEGALDRAAGPLGNFLNLSKQAGGVMPLVSQGIKSAKVALTGLTQSAIAFIATPIGIVLAVLAGAFLLIKNAMNRSEESTNKLSKAFAPLSGLVNKILSALEPLGEFLIDGLVKGLELAEEAFYAVAEAGAAALEFLGFDSAASGVRDFTNNIKETTDAARDLAQAEADLTDAQRKQRLTQLEYQKEAENYRQIRDDESKTIKERIKANQDLLGSLERQNAEELRLANTALLVANLRIKQEGKTKESLDAQAEALTEIADIEERLTGQRSEALTNRNGLEREALALVKERQDAALSANQTELDLFIAQQGFRSKGAEEELEIASKVKDKRIAILDEELKLKKKTQLEYEVAVIEAKNDFLELQRDLVIENAERERELLLNEIENRKTDYEAFTEERLAFEIQNSQDILDNDRLLNETRLEEGSISQQQYQDEILRINNEARLREDEARLEYEESNKERLLLDLENKRILDEEKYLSDFELRAARLEQDRLQEIEAAERTGADLSLINQKYANAQVKIQEEKEMARISAAADTFGGIAKLLGEETEAGKAAAIAQATINTYKGIAEVWGSESVLPEPFATAAKVVSTGVVLAGGLGAVKNIAKTKAERGYISDGRGTLLRGNRHSGGGIQIEAEDGEPILTRGAWKMFPELISDINVAGGGIPLAARGMVAGNKASNSSMVQNRLLQQIDMNLLSETISENVRLGAMEGAKSGSMAGSQEGLIGLSGNRQIEQSSAF